MKNYWLNSLRIGCKVKYVGPDKDLKDLYGKVVDIHGEWVDVQFDFGYKVNEGGFIPPVNSQLTVEREYLEKVRQ